MFTLITTLHKSTFLQDHVSRSQAGRTSHGNLKASKMTRIDINFDPSPSPQKPGPAMRITDQARLDASSK